MKKKTLRALLGSIEHWQENVLDPTNAKIDGSYCSLCTRFNYRSRRCQRGSGEKCPVYNFTGFKVCRGSPWVECDDIFYSRILHENFVESAMGELAFLVDLLPDPE